jgi:hypothetical protein
MTFAAIVEKRTMTTSLLQPLKEKNHDMTFLEHEHEFLSGVNRTIDKSCTPGRLISTHLTSSGILTSSHGFIQSRAQLIFIVASSLFFPRKRKLNFTKKCQHCLHYLGSTHRSGKLSMWSTVLAPLYRKGKNLRSSDNAEIYILVKQ